MNTDGTGSDFEVLIGRFNVDPQYAARDGGYEFPAMYHNSHDPGQPVTLRVTGSAEELVDQIFNLCCPPSLQAEMQAEAYTRILQMHSVLYEAANPREGHLHPLVHERYLGDPERIIGPWDDL